MIKLKHGRPRGSENKAGLEGGTRPQHIDRDAIILHARSYLAVGSCPL